MRSTTTSLRTAALIAFAVATLAAGCGRRPVSTETGSGTAVGASGPAATQTAVPDRVTATDAPGAEPSIDQSSPATAPTGTPVPTPDLTSIEALLAGIGADLNADATATTDEGSPQ